MLWRSWTLLCPLFPNLPGSEWYSGQAIQCQGQILTVRAAINSPILAGWCMSCSFRHTHGSTQWGQGTFQYRLFNGCGYESQGESAFRETSQDVPFAPLLHFFNVQFILFVLNKVQVKEKSTFLVVMACPDIVWQRLHPSLMHSDRCFWCKVIFLNRVVLLSAFIKYKIHISLHKLYTSYDYNQVR